MKIELEIDDKYKNANLYLFWGMVPIARWKWPNQFWEIKTSHCSQCGECCANLEGRQHPFKVVNGVCEYLEPTITGGACSLKNSRPIACSTGDSPLECCTVRWERR